MWAQLTVTDIDLEWVDCNRSFGVGPDKVVAEFGYAPSLFHWYYPNDWRYHHVEDRGDHVIGWRWFGLSLYEIAAWIDGTVRVRVIDHDSEGDVVRDCTWKGLGLAQVLR